MENTKHNHHASGGEEMKGGKNDLEFKVQIAFIAILALLLVFGLGKAYGGNDSSINIASQKPSLQTGTVSAYNVMPSGVPQIYGEELGIRYNDVSASNLKLTESTIDKLTAYEDLNLTEAQMERYIKLGSSIACEYCCGAQTLIFSNGQRACGCAHSYAMRGLAKYMLINHPDVSDEEILSEMGKWKVLFFPGVHEKKAAALDAQGIDYKDYINLASNLYRGIENEAQTSSSSSSSGGSQMVGGC